MSLAARDRFFNQLKEKIILIKMSFLSRIYCSQELVKNLLRVEIDEAVFLCVREQMYITFDTVIFFNFLKFFISLNVGASRLIEAQIDLLCLLFGAGFQNFIVTH